MRIVLAGALVFALFGCAPPRPPMSRSVWTIGRSHEPYHGKPAYLAESQPLVAVNTTRAPRNDCLQHSIACDERLRSTLSAIDGQILALSNPPQDVELESLRLSLRELEPLLAPYPDLMPEEDELKTALTKLPAQPAAIQSVTRKRLLELSDLLRLQLAASQ